MRRRLLLICTLVVSGCGDDHDDCTRISDQIRARAQGDAKLIAMGRGDNPCAEPIPVTDTNYADACGQLRKCLDD